MSKREKKISLEQKFKEEMTCGFLCSDGSGKKPVKHDPMCVFASPTKKEIVKKLKLTPLLKVKIEQGICPRCGFKTNYNYFATEYCCHYCAYPGGELANYK